MDRQISVTLGLMLLVCFQSNTASQTPCPSRCQCFTPAKVLCSDDRMTSLPKDISGQVKDFIVMTTSLLYLFPNTLEEAPQLSRLVFLNNGLRDIHASAFVLLTDLKELEVSGNPLLEKLYQGTFAKQENLTKLVLNFNRFKKVLPGMFNSLSKLEILQMRGNSISFLPTLVFQHLQNLRFLDLSNNVLQEVGRESLSGMDKLETFRLNYNMISGLSEDTFHNVSQLRELSLEGNKISDFPSGIFSALTRLEVLNLRANLLSSFNAEVFGIVPSSLKELTLTGNRLLELSSHSLGSLTSLTQLRLSSNQLSELPVDVFKNLTALEGLDLSENQLTSLPEKIFHQLHNVKSIHLQRNNLSEVHAKMFEDQLLLQQLYLSDNRLQTLPQGLFEPFIFQHIVRLHGNPWNCDCHVWYMHDWLQKHGMDNMEEPDSVTCKGPGTLRGKAVASIDKDKLVCQISQDGIPNINSCTLQAADDTVIIKCKVTTCSQLKVKVQFEDEDDGSVSENVVGNVWPEHLQCNNETSR